MFTHFGPALSQSCGNGIFDVFLDLKFHDIPNTVR
ncbi:orotidine 5'-phosphate decarboxylase / HUMPS family protein [Arsukibacterium sp.]|nr:orotidine 5'-phosphate decarboxylase / HUMPS family protein [Arsukibacterium sp.]